MIVHLADPWFLLLLGLVPLTLFLRARRWPAVGFSDVRLLELEVPPSLRQRLCWLPAALRGLWLGLLVVALARPQTPVASSAVFGEGLALEVVLDVSGSMAAIEATGPDGDVTRLGQVKRFVRDFLLDSDGTPRRPHDAVGLVAFARYPAIVAPLTTDHAALLELLDGLQVDILENRTNIGDALALASDQLRKSSATERVIVLCSDGAHNVEAALSPGNAARIAESLGIRIYTIGVGSPETTQDPEGSKRDEQSLRRIAEITGGRYFRAADGSTLMQVATRLDFLEPSPAKARSYLRWRERFPEVLAFALFLWLLETVLRRTWLRVTPETE